jgi:hypothetical protein
MRSERDDCHLSIADRAHRWQSDRQQITQSRFLL